MNTLKKIKKGFLEDFPVFFKQLKICIDNQIQLKSQYFEIRNLRTFNFTFYTDCITYPFIYVNRGK